MLINITVALQHYTQIECLHKLQYVVFHLHIMNSHEQKDLLTINQLLAQNKRLQQQNLEIKESLEELIAVNSELTQSIELYNNSNALEDRIRELEARNKELENQNRALKKNLHQALKNKTQDSSQQTLRQTEEMAQIIKELIQSSKRTKSEYKQEIYQLRQQIENQQSHCESMIQKIVGEYNERIQTYKNTVVRLKNKKKTISESMEIQMLRQQGKKMQESRRSVKVSGTIEEMRHIYEKEMENKDHIIDIYERVLEKLKKRLKEE